jgi:CheY-like chemotaxis protein
MSAKSGRVLVVDDEESFCQMLADFLDGRGYSVETARDGLEGFRLATREQFDLVIADINMPGVNGVETLRSLQMVENPAKLVVISGYVTDEIAAQCREAGCSEVLNKPVELNRLGELIERLLAENSPQAE